MVTQGLSTIYCEEMLEEGISYRSHNFL